MDTNRHSETCAILDALSLWRAALLAWLFRRWLWILGAVVAVAATVAQVQVQTAPTEASYSENEEDPEPEAMGELEAAYR